MYKARQYVQICIQQKKNINYFRKNRKYIQRSADITKLVLFQRFEIEDRRIDKKKRSPKHFSKSLRLISVKANKNAFWMCLESSTYTLFLQSTIKTCVLYKISILLGRPEFRTFLNYLYYLDL